MLNMWTPFAFEHCPITKVDPDFDEDAVRLFTHHMWTLCDNDAAVCEFVCCWVAHSLQRPGIKLESMLTFISQEGIVKNIFTTILGKLYGKGKVLETTDPMRDVFGSFE